MKHGFLDKYSDLKSPLHSVSPTAKVLVFLSLIVICVTSGATDYLSYAGYFAFLIICLSASHVPVIHVLRRSLVVLPFMAMAALSIPFLGHGAEGAATARGSHAGLTVFQGVVFKSYISVFSLVLLSAVTPFPQLLGALRKLRMPTVFLSLMSFTYRYLFLLIEEFERMIRARDARCYQGGWLWQTKVVGRMIGTFFIRSYERAERVHNAMASRGFDGHVPSDNVRPMRPKDYLFMLTSLAILVGFRVFLAPGRVL